MSFSALLLISVAILLDSGASLAAVNSNELVSKITAAINRFPYTPIFKNPKFIAKYPEFQSEHQSLSQAELQLYLKSSKEIPASDLNIVFVATQLSKNAKSDLEKIQRVHDFVALTLTHVASLPKGIWQPALAICAGEKAPDKDFPFCPWLNPITSLKSGWGHCGSFAQLSAALLRAMGVPARVLQMAPKGREIYMKINNENFVLHQWNEVYVEGKWLQMDVTFDDDGLDQGNIKYNYYLYPSKLIPQEDYFHFYSEIQQEQSSN